MPLHPTTSPNSNDPSSGGRPPKGMILLLTPVQTPRKKLREVPSQKYRFLQVKDLLLFTWNTPPRKPNRNRYPPRISGRMTRILKKPSKVIATPRAPDGLQQDAQDRDDITPHSTFQRRGLTLEETVIHQWILDENTQFSLPIARREEEIPKREASASKQTEACKT